MTSETKRLTESGRFHFTQKRAIMVELWDRERHIRWGANAASNALLPWFLMNTRDLLCCFPWRLLCGS